MNYLKSSEPLVLKELNEIFAFLLTIKIISIIPQLIFVILIITNDLSYDCSDKITNELYKKLNINTKINIIIMFINLAADLLIIIIMIIILILFPKFVKDHLKSSSKKAIKNNNSRDILNQQNNSIISKKKDYNRIINEIKENFGFFGEKKINNKNSVEQSNIPKIQTNTQKLNKDNNISNNDIDDNIPNKNYIILNEQNLGPLRPVFHVNNLNS